MLNKVEVLPVQLLLKSFIFTPQTGFSLSFKCQGYVSLLLGTLNPKYFKPINYPPILGTKGAYLRESRLLWGIKRGLTLTFASCFSQFGYTKKKDRKDVFSCIIFETMCQSGAGEIALFISDLCGFSEGQRPRKQWQTLRPSHQGAHFGEFSC